MNRFKSLLSVLSLIALVVLVAIGITKIAPTSVFAQGQIYTGASGQPYTCGGTTCMTPDISWTPLDTNGQAQTYAAQLLRTVNGSKLLFGANSADITLSTGGTTTDSSTAIIPGGAWILQVVGTVSTTISGGTCTGWQLGDPTTAGRFTANDTTLTAGESQVGMVHMSTGIASATTGMIQPVATGAAKVRVTCATGAPGAGKVRVTVYYIQPTTPLT